ncbi:MAG: dephospho-CoA kinase [Rickettsiales bacterium]|nr:MAG: dephospho-CoA kinase [Rickettsiales bacterium]
MKNIAVTGSFASGKSYVIKQIEKMGYRVFSCDDYVRILYQNIDIQNMIVKEIDGLKVFEKSKLAEIIYNNDELRIKLEKIIHPMVKIGIKNFEQENIEEKLIFTEVPLLYESGFDKYFAHVICVYCSENLRLVRALNRGLKNIEIFEKIKSIQLPQDIKIKLTPHTINSEYEIEDQIKEIIKKIT